jgi:hypothetical protein
VAAAPAACELRFRRAADRTVHGRAAQRRHLRDQQARATRGGMHERGIAGLDGVGAVRQIVRGETLEHNGSRSLEADRGRQLHEPARRHDRVVRIRPEHHRIRHAVADGDLGDTGADVRHGARSLRAQRERQRQRHVTPRAVLNIDEVDAGGRDLDERFAGLRCRHVDVVIAQRLRATAYVNTNCFHSPSSEPGFA